MLSPRWRKVVRDLWLHKSRTSLVISAISIGIIGAGTVLDAWSLVRRATRAEFADSHPASAVLRIDSIDAALLARVRALPSIASVQARRVVFATVQTSAGSRTASLIASNDFTTNAIGVIKSEQGAWPPTDDGAIAERSSVEFAGVSVGDSLSIRVGDGDAHTVRLSGIARDVGLPPGWMEHVVYVFVTPATLHRLGAPSSMNELQILVRDASLSRAGVQSIARDVQHTVEQTGHRVIGINVPVPGRHLHAAQINSLLLTQGAFGLLALVLSGVLVVNLISAMLTGQVREIGVMKAIGARADQIAAMYLALALLLGLVASVISIPVAALSGHWYAEFTGDLLNFDVSSFRIPMWSFALQLAVGTLLPVVAAAFPVARGCRISVTEALRDFGISGHGDSLGGATFARFSGLSRPVLLSLRNAFRRRQRMILTLATLSIGGAVYLGAINLRRAVVDAVDLLFSTQKFDMSFRLAAPHAADSLVAAAMTVDGVAAAEAWTATRAAPASADGSLTSSFPIIAPPVPTRMLSSRVERGRWIAPGSTNELVVNRALIAEDPRFELGGEPMLVIAGKSGRWRIVGVAETAGLSAMAYGSREAVGHYIGTAATSLVMAASSRSMAAQLDLIRRVRAELGDAGFDVATAQSTAQQRTVVEDHLLMVAGFLGNMSLLMIVVGGLGLASTMSLAVLERTREIGVLRAIGAPHGAILAMIQIEGVFIALLSWALAIPLSLPMSVTLGEAFSRIMLKVPLRLVPDAGGVLLWLALVVGVSIVACAWPAYRATRITTAAALASV